MRIFNTISAKVEDFKPFDENCVRIYVCGPTVYDRIHMGNARSIVVFDTLVARLRRKYKKVIYVRNITDVDDKIIKRAGEEKIAVEKLTSKMTELFQQDAKKLLCSEPELQPKATEHIDKMIELIETLIKNKNAYSTTDGHVLFDIKSFPQYGRLAKRAGKLEQQLEGERCLTLECKRAEGDFVLWKPHKVEKTDSEDGRKTSGIADSMADSIFWDSPWGRGRPGWHLECSAMSRLHLGAKIDIHGGGQDLIFPHHENEIAQSRAAYPQEPFVKYWMHNGYVLANGEKMAKSRGNFHLVCDLLKHFNGEVIRLTLLRAHYRQPLNFSFERLEEAEKNLKKLYAKAYSYKSNNKLTNNVDEVDKIGEEKLKQAEVVQAVEEALDNDLNTPRALAIIFSFADKISYKENKQSVKEAQELIAAAALLGLLQDQTRIKQQTTDVINLNNAKIEQASNLIDEKWLQQKITARESARKSGDFKLADQIRAELENHNIKIEDAKISK